MAGEQFDAKARISVEVASKDVSSLIDALASVEDRSGEAGKAVDKLERQLVALSQSAKTAQQALSDTSGLRTQQQGIQKLIAEYNSLGRAMGAQGNRGAVNQQNPLLQQQIRLAQEAARENERVFQRSSAAQIKYAKEAAAAQVEYGKAVEDTQGSIISQRYALYDVARTWAVLSTAILGAAAVSAKLAIDYERNFANVVRTTGAVGSAVGEMRDSLIDLSTEIPVAFGEITEISALGGQLGIAAEGIDNFTSVVARLTATTNLSTEAAGTALGRFQALLGVSSEEFENLGSSILKVGINSVATESQIVSIATQISAMGGFAGLTADQVIGLSGALASVGGQPELSRGTITRTFTLISRAVAEGGDALERFATISGMSAQQFASTWGTAQFGDTFQQFLQGINNEGQNAVQALNDLGITSVRDVPLLLRLAGAGDVVAAAFSDAASGYGEASELGEQFGIIADTVATKLSTLANTIKAIVDAVGGEGLGPLKALLDVVQNLAKVFLNFAQTPVGGFLLGTAASVAVLVGAFAALRSMQALAQASALAMRFALDQQNRAGIAATMTTRGLARTMFEFAVGQQRATAITQAYTTALNGQTTALARVRAGFATAGTAVTVFGSVLRGLLITTGIGAALVGLTALVTTLSNSFKSGGDAAREYFGDLRGLSEAMRADTKIFNEGGDAIRTFTTEVETNSSQLAGWARYIEMAANTKVALNEQTSQSVAGLKEETIALGENTRAQIANMVANDERFQKFFRENAGDLEAIGFNLSDYLNSVFNEEDGATKYLEGLRQGIMDVRDAQLAAVDSAEPFGYEQEQINNNAGDALAVLRGLTDITKALDGSISEAAFNLSFANEVFGAFGLNAEEAGDSVEVLDKSLQDHLDTQYAIIGNTVNVQNAMSNLGKSLFENGASFDAYSESGRANLAALQSALSAMVTAAAGNETVLATHIAGLMQALSGFGVDAVGELAYVQRYLAQLNGGRGAEGLIGVTASANAAAKALGQGFSAGANKAAKSAKSTVEEIRTLTDYVRDLEGVFSAAFDFRFGLDQAIDSVADSYQSLIDFAERAAEAVQDAAQDIMDADAKIQGLKAANTTLEYQLMVALEYGDTLRANEILAEMAENQAKLSKEQKNRTKAEKDLEKAQDATSKSLDGSTEASREQREQIIDLVRAYQDQVVALANTGLNQEELAQRTRELRDQFVAQLTQLGYNRTEIEKYASSFDGLVTAISQVPRNITISANTDPAQRAIDEYLAKVRETSSAVDSLNNRTININAGNTQGARLAALTAEIAVLEANIRNMLNNNNAAGAVRLGDRLAELRRMLNSGNYWGGGFTGRGGKREPAGIVHRGEYVIPKENVDQRTGLPYANALGDIGATSRGSTTNNYYNGGYVTGRGNNIQLVELLPNQLYQLAEMVSNHVEIDGQVIAQAASRSNANNARRGSN